MIEPSGAVFEAKFMLPLDVLEEAAAEKHMAQLQHNMWVANARSPVLSFITGGGELGGNRHRRRSAVSAPTLDCGEEVLALRPVWDTSAIGVEPPGRGWRRSVVVVCVELVGSVRSHLPPHPGPPGARSGQVLKKLVPEDAKEATGHGLRAKRSKSGAISFDLIEMRRWLVHRSSRTIGAIAAALAKAQGRAD